MPLEDDLSQPVSDEELARRKMLTLLGGGALCAAGLGTAVVGFRFLEPNVFFEEDARVGVGRPDEIAPGTVLVLPRKRLYVVRNADGSFYALSSICTHLGCMTRYVPENAQLACPCHGSRFSLEGKVTAGPAPRPLRRLKMTLERGTLVVDASQEVPAGQLFKVT
jgi:cytochrome b6-f complex iron-sulfur subunit